MGYNESVGSITAAIKTWVNYQGRFRMQPILFAFEKVLFFARAKLKPLREIFYDQS